MEWFKIFTFVLAGLGAYIAYRQYEVSKHKVRMELFDRRFKVFDAARVLISHVVVEVKVESKHINVFKLDTIDSPFLFGGDVQCYLKELLEKSVELRMHQLKLNSMLSPEERSSLHDKEHEVLLWFTEQIENLRNPFMPYMNLSS
ncbi:MAG: hypothetical protein V7677_10375 [Motiliproteus sp.]